MKRIICLAFCCVFSFLGFCQSHTEYTLERENARFYTLHKNTFTTYHKHKDSYYKLEEKFEIYRRYVRTKTDTSKVSLLPKELYEVKNITQNNFKNLAHQKFISEKNDMRYELFQFNEEFFVLQTFYIDAEDGHKKIVKTALLPFTYINLGKGKKIIHFMHYNGGFIIPKKDTFTTIVWVSEPNTDFFPITFTRTEAYTASYTSKELFEFSKYMYDIDKYYEIVTLGNKKRLYNFRGEDVLQQKYDSIVLEDFIIGYKPHSIDVYNQTFQQLKLPKLQAVYWGRDNRYNLEVIQNNTLKRIPLSGDTSEPYVITNPTPPYMPTSIPDWKHTIQERKNTYVLHTFLYDTIKIPKEHLKDIFFLKNKRRTLAAVHAPYFVTRHENGLFSMWNLKEPQHVQLQNVTYIEYVGDRIRFLENNLYGFYGIHLKGRYKKLDQFQRFFAPFELPDGRKGWLDRNGKEYVNL